jgi:hypothetical protein
MSVRLVTTYRLSGAKIKELKGTLYRDTMARDCRRSVSSIEAVLKADGDFI